MKKKRAILNFAGIIFVCLILVVLSFVRFTIPNTSNEYVGFLGAIDLGFEYRGGVKITLDVKNNSSDNTDFSKGLDAHAIRINSVLINAGYDARVYTVGGKSIAIEVFNDTDITGLMDLVENTGNNSLSIRAKEDLEAEVFFTQDDVKECYAVQTSSGYGIYIGFTEQGRENFKKLTTQAVSDGKSIYIYIGDTLYKTVNNVSETYDQDYVIIDGGSNATNATEGVGKILSAKYDFSFDQLSKKVVTKQTAQRNLILSSVIVVALIVVCFAILIIRFKGLGLVNALSLFIGLLIQVIMLQAVPVMSLTPSALLASAMIFVLAFVLDYIYLSKIAHEYAQGKKINSSFKFGYQKSFMTMIEAFVAVLVASIVFYIFGSSMVRYFAMALIIGSIIYGLCDLVVSFGFNKMCVNINGHKAQNYGFKREANVDELEEI